MIRPAGRCTRHGVGDEAQIEIDGNVVGGVPVDDGEDEPARDAAWTTAAGSDASRRPSDDASGLCRAVGEDEPVDAESAPASWPSQPTEAGAMRRRRRRVGRGNQRGAGRCGVDADVGVEARGDDGRWATQSDL